MRPDQTGGYRGSEGSEKVRLKANRNGKVQSSTVKVVKWWMMEHWMARLSEKKETMKEIKVG